MSFVHTGFDKDRAIVDVGYFGRRACPELMCDEPERFQRRILQELVSSAQLVSIVVPRGHTKSTDVRVATLHSMATMTPKTIRYEGIVSEAQSQAVDHVQTLENVITDGEAFPKLYPFVRPGDHWGAESFETSHGFKFEAFGTRQRLRGRNYRNIRFNVLTLDDFESEANTESQIERDRIKRWVRGSVKPALRKGVGRLRAIGTLVHEDSYLALIQKQKHWRKIFLRAKREDEDPHPELYGKDGMLWGKAHLNEEGVRVAFDREWWEEERRQCADEGLLDQFYTEFQNEVRPGNPTFKPEDIRYYHDVSFHEGVCHVHVDDQDREGRPVRVVLGVDPSTREHERADFCVLMPVGVDSGGVAYQLPYIRKRFGKDVRAIADAIFELHSLYGFRVVNVETISAQAYIAGELVRQRPERDQWFSILETNPHQGKDPKVYALQPRVATGKLLLHPRASEELVHELTFYPKAKHDDTVDALYLACQIARSWRDKIARDPRVLVLPTGIEVPYRDATWNWKAA